MLHYREKRFAAAITDLERARELGADPAVVSFDLALVDLARGEHAAALENLRRSLSYDPHQPDARKLLNRLLDRDRRRGPYPPTSSRTKGAENLAPDSGPQSR